MYKHTHDGGAEVVGKRIVCSNRYGRGGCGHTRQLYLEGVIPRRHYRLSAVIAFIHALLGGQRVEQAYLNAVDAFAKEARHAWRWVASLFRQLTTWRTLLSKPAETFVSRGRSERLRRLLPTLERLLNSSAVDDIANYQQTYQRAFF